MPVPKTLALIVAAVWASLLCGPLSAQTEGALDAPGGLDAATWRCLQRTWQPGQGVRRPVRRCLRGAGAPVFVMPFEERAEPQSADLDVVPRLQSLDLYVILDRSGSMAAEITAVKNNLATVVRNLTCPPLGEGDPATCIPDLWAGAGTVGYQGSGAQAFQNWVDLRPDPSFTGVPTNEPSSPANFQEPLTFSVYATITGSGGASFTMPSVPPRASCAGSPAANAGYATFGYPCFRQGALPVVVLATDEPPLSAGDTWKPPDWSTIVRPQVIARNAKLIGILGDAPSANTRVDLQRMATDTGTVDAANGNAPLVFDGSGANAAQAIETGVQTLAAGVPLDLRAVVEDDPADSVDAVAAFVERTETLQLGTATCAAGLTERDTDGDAFPDAYAGVPPGTPVCWSVVPRTNASVPATADWRSFHATIRILADDVSEVAVRDVYFLVPPDGSSPAIRTPNAGARRR